MGLMGTAGTLSIYFVLPKMGQIFDQAKIKAAGGEDAFKSLTGDGMNHVLIEASAVSFRCVAIFPLILLVVFGLIWFWDKRQGGYRPVKIENIKEVALPE